MKAAPLAALGLFGVTLGTAAGAAFAGYATAKVMPKVAEEKGALGIDPATGGGMDDNPMAGMKPDRPYLQDWWRQHAPVMLGGTDAKAAGVEVGQKAGEGIRSGIETKAPEVEQQGRALYEKIKELFGQGVRMPINFAPGEGMGGGGAGGGRGDMRAAAERMHGAAERFENASFHGQIDIRGQGGVQAKGMRIKSTGAVSADMGVSMPGAKESDGDWV